MQGAHMHGSWSRKRDKAKHWQGRSGQARAGQVRSGQARAGQGKAGPHLARLSVLLFTHLILVAVEALQKFIM